MKRAANPFLDEGMRTYFSHGIILRSYLFLAGALALVLVLWWPRGTLEAALRSGSGADTFSAVSVAFLVLLMYLGARYGSEAWSPESAGKLGQYVALTPVSVVAVVAGRAGFAFLHTLFLLGLGVPFLLASLAVTGTGAPRVAEALLVTGAATLSVRMYALLLLTLMPGRQFLRDVALMSSVALTLALITALAPAASPLSAVLGLSPARGTAAAPVRLLSVSIPFFLVSVIIALLAALILTGGAIASLKIVRSRARAKETGHT